MTPIAAPSRTIFWICSFKVILSCSNEAGAAFCRERFIRLDSRFLVLNLRDQKARSTARLK